MTYDSRRKNDDCHFNTIQHTTGNRGRFVQIETGRSEWQTRTRLKFLSKTWIQKQGQQCRASIKSWCILNISPVEVNQDGQIAVDKQPTRSLASLISWLHKGGRWSNNANAEPEDELQLRCQASLSKLESDSKRTQIACRIYVNIYRWINMCIYGT